MRRVTFPQLIKVTPTEALLTKIPSNLRYGRQAKYLKSNLPEVLKKLTVDTPVDKSKHSNSTVPKTSPQIRRSQSKVVATRLRRRGNPGSRNLKTVTGMSWRHRLRPRRPVKAEMK